MGKRDLIIYVALKHSEELQNEWKVFHYSEKYFTIYFYCKKVRLMSINFSALQLNQSKLLWLEELTILIMLLPEVP